MENALLDTMFMLPSRPGFNKCIVDKDTITKGEAPACKAAKQISIAEMKTARLRRCIVKKQVFSSLARCKEEIFNKEN